MDRNTILKLIGGMPIKFLVEYPDGNRSYLGGMQVMRSDQILEQIGAGLVGIGLDLIERGDGKPAECAHHTNNPSAN